MAYLTDLWINLAFKQKKKIKISGINLHERMSKIMLPQLRFKINRICKNKKDYNNNIIHDKDTQHLVRSQERKKKGTHRMLNLKGSLLYDIQKYVYNREWQMTTLTGNW